MTMTMKYKFRQIIVMLKTLRGHSQIYKRVGLCSEWSHGVVGVC